jgi:hypothetical protein
MLWKINGKFRLPLAVASFHLLLVCATAMFVNLSLGGQAPLVWGIWVVVDFPVSLLYYLSAYSGPLNAVGAQYPVLAQLLYLPHLIHGVAGTLWWYGLTVACQYVFRYICLFLKGAD